MYQVISSEEMAQYTSKGKKQHHFWTLIPPSSFTGPLPGQSQKPILPASLAPCQANLKSQYCQLHWPLARPISKANIASFPGPLPGQSQKPILPNPGAGPQTGRPCPCRRPSVVTEGYRGVPPQPRPQLGVTPSPPRRHPLPTSAVSVTAMGESISTANVGEHRVNIGAR